jgi:hypothetical protein
VLGTVETGGVTMATKADFTDEEWKALQSGISGSGMLVAVSDAGFFDTFKEASTLAKHLSAAHEKNDDALVREIAAGHHNPFGITSSPAEVEQGTVAALQAALAALQAKAPESVEAYKAVVLDVAQSVAEAASGVKPGETQAIEKIKAALGGEAPAAAAAPSAG